MQASLRGSNYQQYYDYESLDCTTRHNIHHHHHLHHLTADDSIQLSPAQPQPQTHQLLQAPSNDTFDQHHPISANQSTTCYNSELQQVDHQPPVSVVGSYEQLFSYQTQHHQQYQLLENNNQQHLTDNHVQNEELDGENLYQQNGQKIYQTLYFEQVNLGENCQIEQPAQPVDTHSEIAQSQPFQVNQPAIESNGSASAFATLHNAHHQPMAELDGCTYFQYHHQQQQHPHEEPTNQQSQHHQHSHLESFLPAIAAHPRVYPDNQALSDAQNHVYQALDVSSAFELNQSVNGGQQQSEVSQLLPISNEQQDYLLQQQHNGKHHLTTEIVKSPDYNNRHIPLSYIGSTNESTSGVNSVAQSSTQGESHSSPGSVSSCSSGSDESTGSTSLTRDERRAREANIPLTYYDIVNLSIDQFNEQLTKHNLTESQLTLIKDIRRRGKNKVAAQSCRKRKMEQIYELQHEVNQLMNKRRALSCERAQLAKEHENIVQEYDKVYAIIHKQIH